MTYGSVDALQRALTRDVFHYAKDAKKAAGRALGTLVEIITFYLLKSWGLEHHTAIERRLPEYANPGITHNVEFTLHPSREIVSFLVPKDSLPITARKLAKLPPATRRLPSEPKDTQLLSSDRVLRNACIMHEDSARMVVAYLGEATSSGYQVCIRQLMPHPFAVLECKRVGVEEGTRKGPQTIEKAKQGAYVARSVSSLQKIRMSDGSIHGVLHLDTGELRHEPYDMFLRAVIASNEASLLRAFTLTVGVVSNHGNWFTSNDHNKELRVLAQSYDWLLFLTDKGLSAFVEDLLVRPTSEHRPIRDAFVRSHTGRKGNNSFTKVQVALDADRALQRYFASHAAEILRWFMVISPHERSIAELRKELELLSMKDWKEILS